MGIAARVTSSVPLVAPDSTCYMGLGVRPGGVIYASYDDENSDKSIYTLNPVTGTRTLVGSTDPYFVHDLVFLGPVVSVVNTVPTLSESVMLALAVLVALAGVARMRGRSRG